MILFVFLKGICVLNMNLDEKAIKVFQMVKDSDPSLNEKRIITNLRYKQIFIYNVNIIFNRAI